MDAISSKFVNVKELIPSIFTSVRYCDKHNFLGRKVRGYVDPVIYLTKEAAAALQQAQQEFILYGFSLVLYDGFRPQQAVDDFIEWSNTADQTMKEWYYPSLKKPELFAKGKHSVFFPIANRVTRLYRSQVWPFKREHARCFITSLELLPQTRTRVQPP